METARVSPKGKRRLSSEEFLPRVGEDVRTEWVNGGPYSRRQKVLAKQWLSSCAMSWGFLSLFLTWVSLPICSHDNLI